MGRAMLIICAGVLFSLAIIGISTADQGKLFTEKTVTYAQEVAAKNAAHTAIQIAMQKLSEDSTWAEHHGSTNPMITDIDNARDTLYAQYLNDYKNNNFWDNDSLLLVSQATIDSTYQATVRSVYLVSPFSNLVPPFKSALTIATNQVSPFYASGSTAIQGSAPTGSGCSDKPAVTIQPPKGSGTDSTTYMNQLKNITTTGTKTMDIDKQLTYQPTDKLIARLQNSPDTQFLPEGKYLGDLGTKDKPGVFFVDKDAILNGGVTEGYGILVVRKGGGMSYDSTTTSLKISGDFTFNGLVIFQNAYNLNGKGTPTINGSVLIGNTTDYVDNIDVNINGNLTFQYSCVAEEYAKKSAAMAIQQNKYTRVVSMEESKIVHLK